MNKQIKRNFLLKSFKKETMKQASAVFLALLLFLQTPYLSYSFADEPAKKPTKTSDSQKINQYYEKFLEKAQKFFTIEYQNKQDSKHGSVEITTATVHDQSAVEILRRIMKEELSEQDKQDVVDSKNIKHTKTIQKIITKIKGANAYETSRRTLSIVRFFIVGGTSGYMVYLSNPEAPWLLITVMSGMSSGAIQYFNQIFLDFLSQPIKKNKKHKIKKSTEYSQLSDEKNLVFNLESLKNRLDRTTYKAKNFFYLEREKSSSRFNYYLKWLATELVYVGTISYVAEMMVGQVSANFLYEVALSSVLGTAFQGSLEIMNLVIRKYKETEIAFSLKKDIESRQKISLDLSLSSLEEKMRSVGIWNQVRFHKIKAFYKRVADLKDVNLVDTIIADKRLDKLTQEASSKGWGGEVDFKKIMLKPLIHQALLSNLDHKAKNIKNKNSVDRRSILFSALVGGLIFSSVLGNQDPVLMGLTYNHLILAFIGPLIALVVGKHYTDKTKNLNQAESRSQRKAREAKIGKCLESF